MVTPAVPEQWLVECEERAALARDGMADPVVVAAYARAAAERDVPELVRVLRELRAWHGGDLGLLIRDAVRGRIVRELPLAQETQRIATLHPDVRVGSLAVHLVDGSLAAGGGQVVVDVRLIVGGG